ncbi:MAG TPA: hypothetical protein VJR89_02755, partial [Polyangiales bacterium]|nr:hypothetical protein [Polyangiales bacterium]
MAEQAREPAPRSSWPFAVPTPVTPKPEQLVREVRVSEADEESSERATARALGAEAEVPAAVAPPVQAPRIQVPPPAGHTEPPLAPQVCASDASAPSIASSVEPSSGEPSAEALAAELESASLLEAAPAADEAIGPSEPPAERVPDTATAAADGGEQAEPGIEERASRARIVERLWDDPIREELEVNLGTTTESNLYVDVDQRVASG